MSCRSSTLYIVLVVLLAMAEAFSPYFQSVQRATHLHLTPEQGQQLVAAWSAASSHYLDDDEETHHIPHHEEKKKLSSTRAFVSRVFSIPSSMIRRHPYPKAEGLEDVVYYPIVGFQFVPSDEHHSRVLPTTSRASCQLHPTGQDLFGWYTYVCSLGNLYADDYGQDPTTRSSSSLKP